MDLKKQSEIRRSPIKEPHRLNIILDSDTMKRLKSKALELDTTAAEIIRSLVEWYLEGYEDKSKVFFVIHYGIKRYNSNGSERSGCDDMVSGAFYVDINKAIENQRLWFDGMIEEMKRHSPATRKTEKAYSYIEAVTGVTEDSDGEPVEWMTLDKEIQDKINASSKEFWGKDIPGHTLLSIQPPKTHQKNVSRFHRKT